MVDFPKAWKNKWNEWDIRVAVLISLLLQILLIVFASWRRRKESKKFTLFIWTTYLLADWVAAFALGLIRSNPGRSNCDNNDQMHSNSKIKTFSIASKDNHASQYDDKLHAFWAPFLLLHLGGPDTITAFSMEDNELWSRHLLGLLFEVGAALYVFLRSVPSNPLLFPTLLMFLAGIIKYGERTYALYRASLDGFRDSLLKKPDPGPDYARLMEEYSYKKDCGVDVTIEISKEPMNEWQPLDKINRSTKSSDVQKLQEAFKLFDKFKGMIVELIFSLKERNESLTAFLKKPAQEAFRVVEFELSFVYEVLFTKAVVVHEHYGYVLRAICSCSIMGTFLSFFFLSRRHKFREVDIVITYTLLGGAICLDAFAFVMLILSDWTIIKLQNYPSCKWISSLFIKVSPRQRWSATVTQHSLIHYCIPIGPSYRKKIMDRPSGLGKVLQAMGIDPLARWLDIFVKMIDEVQYTWREGVTEELKEHIYEQLKKKARTVAGIDDPIEIQRVCSCRGDWALEEMGYLETFGYSIEVEFDESLLLWHIATDLCYYTDENIGKDENKEPGEDETVPINTSMHRRFCKLMSDYLVYLLVMRPFMMSSSVMGKIRYRDTCAEAKYFFKRRPLDHEPNLEKQKIACINLLSVITKDATPAVVKGQSTAVTDPVQDKISEDAHKRANRAGKPVSTEAVTSEANGHGSKSVLFDACFLAITLKTEVKSVQKRWEMMSTVWIEILAYAASRCPGIAHAQTLSKGGELLTFVWFLMTRLGLGEQYQIASGAARAKLIVQK